ncbi:peptidoglycan editing factor PgeF [Aquincola tertiaricarbonis]|uniref:peptidoglycan editing factor PgeF n=1 Tax=Aquincola tertiaricarbonis TaxID=391953 RepID=UPI0006153B50|nr:peptidoglycan editing factor PgeF [Aquincola tertiaricarbonis]
MRSDLLATGLTPDWPVPPGVGAWMSSREGGVSHGPWQGLNLGMAVGDDPAAVAENRRRFAEAIGAAPVFLRQVHGRTVLRLTAADARRSEPLEADAAFTTEPGVACTVQVADCLPVLFAAPHGRGVAAAHAGWRGLAGGVLDATVAALCDAAGCGPDALQAWLGPCIGPRQFEVGAEVLQAFGGDPAGDRRFIPRRRPDGELRWLADLPALARERLAACGVAATTGGAWCTVETPLRFFSYRRDGVTGRLAAAIWLR